MSCARPTTVELVVLAGGTGEAALRLLDDRLRERSALSALVTVVERHRDGHAAAVTAAWRASRAEVVAYADLAAVGAGTVVAALTALVSPLLSGQADVSAGSGVADRGSRVLAGVLSRGFGCVAGTPRFPLKAARRDAVLPLLDRLAGTGWFFDTALLLLARQDGLRLHEAGAGAGHVPVPSATWAHFTGLVRMAYRLATGSGGTQPLPPAVTVIRLAMFGIVGALSGLLYVLLYLLLRQVVPPAVANLGALVASALANTEANRHWTFTRARVARVGMHLRAAVLFGAHYAITTAAVQVLLWLDPGAGAVAEVVTLLGADLVMTVLRFIGLDRWVFRRGEITRTGGRSHARH
ncbi:GtrA family protein [Amycolatopsis suaedae]|uniref:GtrA family protein n=1 Tax=Amycolatopsis suaedae TaxID=2510978 RepID=UPI0013EF240E|nr:GtrA family protein [Amycolatopsis suaedae]